ncbi:MAG: alanine--tRNA ligase [Armatimonadetes bacterium]|nr:alanine--tRNA ligase [Armatimonadota bacterium]
MLSSNEIRKQFIDFFEKKKHKAVPSAPVIPIDDPTLLFTNAGMNQFKNIFLGQKKPEYLRVVNSQKCIRAGGKHNDLEEVGKDGYHHTFFEMLGNWSFGDYYKKEAITWAWELLTEIWKMPKDKLYATVHKTDEEAYELWKTETDINPDHIEYHEDKDNFWEMGATGPCGPCSEIHMDRGEEFCNLKHLENHKCKVNGDCHRFFELWNLVFIQYNRGKDGKLTPLANKFVDTGAGFERIVQVLQNKKSNYDTDLFQPIIQKISEMSEIEYFADDRGTSHRVISDHIRALTFALADGGMPSNEGRGYVLRRILRRAARHGRLLHLKKPFLYILVDTVVELMSHHYSELKERQAHIKLVIKTEEERFNLTLDNGISKFEEIKHNQLEIISDFLSRKDTLNWMKQLEKLRENYANNEAIKQMTKLIDNFANSEVMKQMKESMIQAKKLSEVYANNDTIKQMTKLAENFTNSEFMKQMKESVTQTKKLSEIYVNSDAIKQMKKLADDFANSEIMEQMKESMIQAKKLSKSLTIPGSNAFQLYDTFGFPLDLTKIMAEEKGLEVDVEGFQKEMEKQKIRGRESKNFDMKTSKISQLGLSTSIKTRFVGYQQHSIKTRIVKHYVDEEKKVVIVLEETPFYAESGGQVADIGEISNDGFKVKITEVQKENDVYFHFGKLVSGVINSEDVFAEIDKENRKNIAGNHTATHLLHKALREILGKHVQQKGSFVSPDHLRFDFTHFQQVSQRELVLIERIVNNKIRECIPLKIEIKEIKEARKEGAIALFGEKYDEKVRVVSIGDYSKELCGGTHLNFTGEIGFFKMTSESSIAAGIRRIEAITGFAAEKYVKILEDEIDEIGRFLNTPQFKIMEKMKKIISENKELHLKIRGFRIKSSGSKMDELIKQAPIINDIKVAAAKIKVSNPNEMRQIGDQLRDKLKSGIGVLIAETNGKVGILAIVTKDLTNKYHAGKIAGKIAEIVGGKGGGRPDMAMAGGKDVSKIDEAIKKVKEIIKEI